MKGTGEQDISLEEKSWRGGNVRIARDRLSFSYFLFLFLFYFLFLELKVKVSDGYKSQDT